jgi:hypothetical protein
LDTLTIGTSENKKAVLATAVHPIVRASTGGVQLVATLVLAPTNFHENRAVPNRVHCDWSPVAARVALGLCQCSILLKQINDRIERKVAH